MVKRATGARADGDSTGRRSRSRANPTGKIVRLTQRDLAWLQALHQHGPLSTTELHGFTAGVFPSLRNTRTRLTDLFHEVVAPYSKQLIYRPAQQFEALDARNKELVYDLTPSGIAALVEHDRLAYHQPKSSGPWWHQRLVARTTARLELACKMRSDLNFIPAHQILERADTELRFETSIIETSGPKAGQRVKRDLIPDGLFGLEYVSQYDGNSYRFFALEIDRGTEPLRSSAPQRKSALRMLRQYEDWLGNGKYKQHLGLTAPLIALFITTKAGRADQVRELAQAETPDAPMFFAHVDDPRASPLEELQNQPRADLGKGTNIGANLSGDGLFRFCSVNGAAQHIDQIKMDSAQSANMG